MLITLTDEDDVLNVIPDTGGDDFLHGTAGNDIFKLKGGDNNILLGEGGNGVFDLSGPLNKCNQDTNRLFDWSESDELTGIKLADVDLATAFSFGVGVRFEYGPDQDIMIVKGEHVPATLTGVFGADFLL